MKYLGDNTWVTIDTSHVYGLTFVWNGALTVRVKSGSTELDVITFMEQPTRSQVEAAINRRIKEGSE